MKHDDSGGTGQGTGRPPEAASPTPARPAAAHRQERQGLRGLLAWPGRCRVCHGWPSQTLCPDCVALFTPAVPRCPRCALRLPQAYGLPGAPGQPKWPEPPGTPALAVQPQETTEPETAQPGAATAPAPTPGSGPGPGPGPCPACLREPPPLAWTLTRADYAYPWSFLLGQLKFAGDIGLARALGAWMAATPGLEARLEVSDWIVPLPLAPRRLGERGFNQSSALTRALLRQLPGQRRKFAPALLEKPLETPAQHTLPRAQRLANVRRSYRVPPAALAQIADRRILLVDDIMTTGASLGAAACALLEAGAREVGALVLARA